MDEVVDEEVDERDGVESDEDHEERDGLLPALGVVLRLLGHVVDEERLVDEFEVALQEVIEGELPLEVEQELD